MTTELLHYSVRGDGPKPIVLLHGFLGAGRNLASLARRYTERDPECHIILLDLPGHGRSPPLPAQATLAHMAELVLKTVEFLRVDRPLRVVGHSLGGRVGLRMLDLAPEALSHLVLLDISPAPIRQAAGRLDQIVDLLVSAPSSGTTRQAIGEHFLRGGVPSDLVSWLLLNTRPDGTGSVTWHIDRERLAAFHAEGVTENLWGTLTANRGKVQCIRGGASRFVSDDDALEMERLGCKVTTIPGADHFIHTMRQEELLDLLTSPTFW